MHQGRLYVQDVMTRGSAGDTTPVYLSRAAVCGHYDKPGVPEVL